MKRRVPLLALAAALIPLLATPGPVAGQGDVAAVAGTVAAAWSAGDLDGLERHLPEHGIHLSLDGQEDEGLSRRQARAALDRFLQRFEPAAASVRRAEALGGDPARGLVELVWTARAGGTPEERRFVIFLSLERSDDAWHIREIRVFS